MAMHCFYLESFMWKNIPGSHEILNILFCFKSYSITLILYELSDIYFDLTATNSMTKIGIEVELYLLLMIPHNYH